MEWTNEELQAIVDEHALVLFHERNPKSSTMRFF